MKEVISIQLTHNEALVLFEFLGRINELEDKISEKKETSKIFEDESELKVLWDIEAQLERVLVEPFNPDCKEIIDRARKEINENR